MTDITSIYPINKIEDKKIETWINPETGEIIDEEIASKEINEKESEAMQKTLINKVKIARSLQGVVTAEIENLKKLLVVQQNREKNMTKLLAVIMRSQGLTELDFETVKAKFKKNPPALIIAAGTDLSEYTKVEMIEKIDKVLIKKELKDGKKVKGCKLSQEERLEIK